MSGPASVTPVHPRSLTPDRLAAELVGQGLVAAEADDDPHLRAITGGG